MAISNNATATSKPLILDADALNLLAKSNGLPENHLNRILTPHPVEWRHGRCAGGIMCPGLKFLGACATQYGYSAEDNAASTAGERDLIASDIFPYLRHWVN